jgi:predicted Zn-dependent peptidase
LLPPIPPRKFVRKQPKESVVYFAPFDANQIRLSMYSCKGEKYDINRVPIIRMYNEYFGGGMSAIVFQEMREARALAYSAGANLRSPSKLDDVYYFQTFIGTQNDKMDDAVSAFNMIINDMPVSDKSFNLAKQSIISDIRTQRTTKNRILWSYISCQDLGLDAPTTKLVFDQVQKFTMKDVQKFQQDNIKNRIYTFAILGREEELDFVKMATYGKIHKLTLEDIFGY